jgi:hypothetical protein
VWQFDRKATHDGLKNRNSFVKDNKTITLGPFKKNLSPRVQKKMMKKRVKGTKRVKRKERVGKMRGK